ncbi:MAG: SseB family protein [Tepidisphaeraceae bacterium]
MTIEEIIRQNADRPIEESITPIATSLAGHRIFLATDDTTAKTTQPTTAKTQPTTGPTTQARSFKELVNSLKKPGITIEFKSGKDAQGRVWAYAYTSPAEFDRAHSPEHPSTELSFSHFFGMIEGEPHFAGIRLNPGSDASYTIPRELFEKVKEQLPRRRPADG